MWDAEKVALRGEFIALNVYIRKENRLQINHLSVHLRKIGKEEQIKFKVSKRKEIIRIRAEINRGNQ